MTSAVHIRLHQRSRVSADQYWIKHLHGFLLYGREKVLYTKHLKIYTLFLRLRPLLWCYKYIVVLLFKGKFLTGSELNIIFQQQFWLCIFCKLVAKIHPVTWAGTEGWGPRKYKACRSSPDSDSEVTQKPPLVSARAPACAPTGMYSCTPLSAFINNHWPFSSWLTAVD